MYKNEVKEIKSMKRECNYMIFKDVLILYIKCKFCFGDDKCCDKLFPLLSDWFHYSNRENQILNFIYRKYGSYSNIDIVDEVIDYLDDIYQRMFDYYDNIFASYEDAIMMRQVWRSNFREPSFTQLDEKNKNKCLEKLRS